METISLSRKFARWANELTYEDLPAPVISKIKAFLLNGLTGAALGYCGAIGKEAVELTLEEEAKADGASILASGSKATRYGAAYANSELMHSSELWDSYRMLTHPGPVLIPAALACAELENRSGKELIVALAVGYEFMCRLCDDFIPSTAARGFRPSPIYSTLGGALACAKLLDLGEDGLVSAIALASNFASGLNEGPRVGGNEISIHEPQAARNAVFAGIIARTGHIKGAESSLEGEAGFYNAFTGSFKGELSYVFQGPKEVDLKTIAHDLGETYKLLSVMFRIYPCAGFNQPVIELMTELKKEHKFHADDIDEIEVTMNWIETLYPSPKFPRESWTRPGIQTTHFYVAHVALNGGFPTVGGKTFGPTGNRLTEDTAVIDFLHKRVKITGDKDRPMFSPKISIKLKNGSAIFGQYPYSRLEWGFDDLVHRLNDCVIPLKQGKAGFQRLVDKIGKLEELQNIMPLIKITQEI